VHNQVCVDEDDAEGRSRLAGYMLRAPMSLEKMTYDAATGTVIHRSRMHVGPKRNFQRGERAKKRSGDSTPPSGAPKPANEPAPRASATWAKLIRRV
jgi:hypothetical protein